MTLDFLQKNLFKKLRADHFDTKEQLDPMTTFKKQKIAQMMKNLSDIPSGEVAMHSGFLNKRLIKIQQDEPHAIDTSMETIYLLRLIVSNVNAMYSGGISLRGIIQLGQYLRTRGDKARHMAHQAPHPAHGSVGRQRAHPVLQLRARRDSICQDGGTRSQQAHRTLSIL